MSVRRRRGGGRREEEKKRIEKISHSLTMIPRNLKAIVKLLREARRKVGVHKRDRSRFELFEVGVYKLADDIVPLPLTTPRPKK